MQPKKYVLLLAFLALFTQAGFSQGDAVSVTKDTGKVSARNQAQLNDFLNHSYPYPPRPRSKWELGFGVGRSIISGDVRSKTDLGGSITLRKALSHTFSVRLGYFGSYNQGYPSKWGEIIGQRSYQNWSHSEAIDFIASLNPISHYRGNPKTNIYLLGGVQHTATIVYYKANPGQGNRIDKEYKVFYGGYSPNRDPNTRAGLLGTHGTFKDRRTGRAAWSSLIGFSAGAGFAVKLSSKVNLAIEQRYTFTNYDYLDAFKGEDNKDYYIYTSGRINFNLGSSAKKVEPLWWINPNNYVYNELNRPSHMIIPPPVLPDADNDGVTDQFDMEPNTPSGAPVDVRGVAKDTDGDGVPDYKDKELLTSSKCLPVNGDGVGSCPEPACCTELRSRIDSIKQHGGGGGGGGGEENCGLNNLPSIKFAAGSATLNAANVALLANAAAQIKGQPDCHVNVIGHGASDKRSQQMSWERVNSVINYFVNKQGISRGRFIFTYNGPEGGDSNSVDLVGTKDSGPNTVPAPHPNLRSKR